MTSRVPTGEWEQLVRHQTYLLHLGRAMFFIAFLSLLPAIWGKPITMPAGVTFLIFAMWIFNARGLSSRIADLVAARDMKRIVKEARGARNNIIHLTAGDDMKIIGEHIIRPSCAVTLEIDP